MFQTLYKEKIENNEYHPKDLERVNKDNEWMKAFHKHGLEDHNKTVDVMDEILTWRKNFGANGLNDSSTSLNYINPTF